MSVGDLKAWLVRLYDRHGERWGIDRLEAVLTPPPAAANRPYPLDAVDGEVPGIRFLAATSAAGLLLFDGARATTLFDAYTRRQDGMGGFYGISRRGERWYAYQRVAATGRLISFRLDGDRAVDARTEMAGGPRSVHQIDFIGDVLWLVDTYNNRVLEVPAAALGNGWRRAVREHYPNGRLVDGVRSPNYSHFNSVFGVGGTTWLVAHNESVKTHRHSELFVLGPDGALLERRDLGGSCCHNICLLDGEPVSCRSWEGTVNVAGRDVLSLGSFTRGLSLGPDHHLVGASGIETQRAARDLARSRIVVTDPAFVPVATLHLGHTQVHELRRVDVEDLGLSAFAGSSSASRAPAARQASPHPATA
jgi:hypothetical protein